MIRITALLIYLLSLIIIGSAKSPGYAQTATNSVPQYDLTIRVLPDAHRLEVSGTLRLPSATKSRSEIRLSLSELMHDFNVEVMEPTASAGIAKVEGRDANGKNIKWTVRPIRPVPASEVIKLRFSYAGGEKLANQFFVGTEVSFASAWGTDWYPLVDGENDKGIGSLRFSVPTGQTVMPPVAVVVRLKKQNEVYSGLRLFIRHTLRLQQVTTLSFDAMLLFQQRLTCYTLART